MKRYIWIGFLSLIFIGSFSSSASFAIIPGQYVEEVQAGAYIKPITPLPTAIGGMVGATEKGPENGPPVAVTSFALFQQIFGGYLDAKWGDSRYLAYAVQGFFANGGRKLYIKRVAGKLGSMPSPADYIGADNGPGRRTGIQALLDIDEIALVAVPGISNPGVQDALLQHCEKAGDRFAVLDVPGQAGSNSAISFRNHFNTKNAALYYPWVTVTDPGAGQSVSVPPSGHVLGYYAYRDNTAGVHKAPANTELKGITGPEYQVTGQEVNNLNFQAVNCIRFLSGRGNLIWGARTLSSDPEWKYIPVRRLVLMITESIRKGTAWVVFEPNNERTWAKVKQQVDNFLQEEWKNGALLGSRPEQAYFVKVDRSTMTQRDLDEGRLVIEIGIAPVRPAEFMILRVGQSQSH